MHGTQVFKFSDALRTKPYMIDGGDFTYCYRKRLYWCNWNILPSDFVKVTDKGHFFHVEVTVTKPPSFSWISDNSLWIGPHLIPTLTRALPSEKPMKKPAGISDASEIAKQRWSADKRTFQVYNYEDRNIFFNPETGAFRLPTAEEAELLMGIDKYYTLGASKDDSDSRASFVIRRQLIGNSFNCYAVCFLLGQLLESLGNEIIPLETYMQVGVADRPVADLNMNDPDFVDNKELAVSLVEQYLCIAEKGGSDVRLELGVPFRPGAWPRAGAKTQYCGPSHMVTLGGTQLMYISTNWNFWLFSIL